MKRISAIIILLAITTTISASLLYYNAADVITDISTAIKSGVSTNVSKYFNSTLDLTTPDNEGTYSKTQAELILKDFFTKHPVASFKIDHQGSSVDGSQYAIGTYVSGSTSYRTYFLLKKSTAGSLIQKLEFEVQ